MKELEISRRKRQENLEHNLLGEIYFSLLDAGAGKRQSVDQLESDAKFEAAVKDGSSPNVIIDLAAEWCCAECESAFKLGFQFAMKILKEGETDIYA